MAPAAELVATMRLAIEEARIGDMIDLDKLASLAAAHSEQASRELLDLLRAGLDGWDSGDIERVEKATGCRVEDPPVETAEDDRRTLRSLACMLGWGNVPPRETFEAEIRALKARAASTGPAGHNVGTCGCMSCGMARAANREAFREELDAALTRLAEMTERCLLAESTRDAAQAHASATALRYQEVVGELVVQMKIVGSLRLEAEEGHAAILRRAEAAEQDMIALQRRCDDLQAAYDGDDRSRR
jgi:hypothetical protein